MRLLWLDGSSVSTTGGIHLFIARTERRPRRPVGPGVWSRDVGADFVVCSAGRETTLEANADAVARGIEQWGVVSSGTTRNRANAPSGCCGTVGPDCFSSAAGAALSNQAR